jgi:hypothetical protein
MIDNEKLDAIDALIFGRNRTANWRRMMAANIRSKSLSEVEYDGLLDAVRTAIAPLPEEGFLAHPLTFFDFL